MNTDTCKIIVAYTDDQDGQSIRSQDVVTANNGIWFTEEEKRSMTDKSCMRCPTYGSCQHCWKSGPVAKRCTSCNDEMCGYSFIFYTTPYGEMRLLDSQFLSGLLGTGHETVMANRTIVRERSHTLRPNQFIGMYRYMLNEKQYSQPVHDILINTMTQTFETTIIRADHPDHPSPIAPAQSGEPAWLFR